MSAARSQLHGVLVVDKPEGWTSHDVVGRARKLLGTRRIGHAGTLDPMATGVLVLLVGEATKLGPYLTADDKCYDARVSFGVATDTLDREGAPIARAEPPAWLREELAAIARGEAATRIEAALEQERARTLQKPPAWSAIKVDGRRSYARARAGEEVDLEERSVAVRSLLARSAAPEAEAPSLDLSLSVSKGYYVRSLARDLGNALGVPAHLSLLRRTRSGSFSLDVAILLEQGAHALESALVPLVRAASLALPLARLTNEGALKARQGKRLHASDFEELASSAGPAAWLSAEGALVAIGTSEIEEAPGERSCFRILRGFAEEPGAARMGTSPAAPRLEPDEPGASVLLSGRPPDSDRR